MLWYRSWLETRWRFLIGFVWLICSAAVVLLMYPATVERLVDVDALGTDSLSGAFADYLRQELELMSDYRGYVWSQWFRQSMRETWTIFAVLIGTGGLLTQTSGGAALFTLSLPVTRQRLVLVRAGTGLSELLAMAIAAALVVPLLSSVVGETYGFGDALLHGLCLAIAGSVFFSLATFLSTVFTDVWRPAIIALVVAYSLYFVEAAPSPVRIGITGVMTAERYFRTGDLPVVGLLICAAASAALLYAASLNVARRDF
jgi:ABC-type transport system involved in multi-copper enzyme maturation permease subunit